MLSEVCFLTYNNTRYFRFSGEVEDLVVHDRDHVERLAVGNVVDKDVAVDANSVLGVEDGELVLDRIR